MVCKNTLPTLHWMRGPLWPAIWIILDTSSWRSATRKGNPCIPRMPMAVRGYVMSTRTTYSVQGLPERLVLNHAPIGEYYRRFNIPGHDTHECECGHPTQTRRHIFTHCGVLETLDRIPRFLREFVGFLMENPPAFSFGFQYRHPPPVGIG